MKINVTSKNGFQSSATIDVTQRTILKEEDASKKYPRGINFHQGAMIIIESQEENDSLMQALGYVITENV